MRNTKNLIHFSVKNIIIRMADLLESQADLLSLTTTDQFLDETIQQDNVDDVVEQEDNYNPDEQSPVALEAPPHPSKIVSAAKRSPKKAMLRNT